MRFYSLLVSRRNNLDKTTGDVVIPAPNCHITWQDKVWRNTDAERYGACIEDVIIAAYLRLYYLNQKYPCRENEQALTKLEEAVLWLDARTADRIDRGVLGKEEA